MGGKQSLFINEYVHTGSSTKHGEGEVVQTAGGDKIYIQTLHCSTASLRNGVRQSRLPQSNPGDRLVSTRQKLEVHNCFHS